jgi:Tol biopolymer transport system component
MTTQPLAALSVTSLFIFLAGCDAESPATTPAITGVLAFEQAAGDAPRFSDWSAPVNLGPVVNSPFIEQGASVSKDGLSLYFHCTGCSTGTGADLYVSQRASVEDPWGPPQRLGSNVNTTDNETAPTVSLDGHQLFFARDGQTGFGGTDLYVSHRRDKRDDFGWEPAVNLGSGINTTANEAQATLFKDDETETTTLYFSSNRPGGPGLDDIYASTLQPDGTFGPAVPVVELNTSSNDRQPAVRRDGLEMFLGSDRPGTLGGIDIWVSTRGTTHDAWSAPVNLGPVVNTTLIDARPALSFDGTTLYFQSNRAGAVGCSSPTGPCVFDLWVTTRTRLHGGGDADRAVKPVGS